MFSKGLLPLFLFSSLALPSVYFMSSPLSEGELDHNFYDNERLFTRFGNSKVIYKTSIEDDSIRIRDYLLNGSFNLYWGDSSNADQGIYSNAFLLNVLYPDHVDKDDPERLSYTPRYLFSGEDIIFLVGTSFSFVKKLFSQINNWGSEVNDATNEVTLESKGDTNGSKKFYFSHPFPLADEKNQNSKITQDYLYRLDTTNEAFKHMDYGIKKPHYFEVDKKNVSVVYAGIDLSINKRLLNLNFHSNSYIQKQLLDIHSQIPIWTEKIGDRKIATDFAVLKLKLKASDIRHPFMSYLQKLYSKETRIPKVLNTHMNLVAGKTDSVFMGGWSRLTSQETDSITMDNLFIKADQKADKDSEIQKKFPSEISNKTTLEQYFDLDLYDKYSQSQNTTPSKSSKSSKYEIIDLVFYPNDPSGVLVVKFRIQNKSTKQKSSEKTIMFSGFKSTGATLDIEKNAIDNTRKQKQLNDMNLVQFLESEPKAVARWKEMHINHSYFYAESLNNAMFGDFYFRGDIKLTEDFELGGNKYLDISHNLNVPNLNFKDARGMIALTKKHEGNEKVMIGMYEGSTEWNNVISGQDRYVGKIMLFTSPFRYDLFNENNSLSKPSLADSLKKKNMDHKLIQTNRFYSSYSSSRSVN